MSTEKSKNVVITKKARENLVKARAGAITLPKIIGNESSYSELRSWCRQRSN